MSFEYFTQGFNGLNDKQDGLPRFPHENEIGRPYEIVPGRTSSKIKNPIIQKYILSISRAIVDLHKITENDDQLIADFTDSVAKIDTVINHLRPKGRHFKNVKEKVESQRSVSPIQQRQAAIKQTTEPAAAEKQLVQRSITQKPAAQKQTQASNPFKPHTGYVHSIIPPNYIQVPPQPKQEPTQNIPESQKKVPVNEQEYVSMSGLQQSKDVTKSIDLGEHPLNRIDSFSQMDSYTDIAPQGKLLTESDSKGNPFSSLEERLNYLINERKNVEKSARSDSRRLLPQNINIKK